MKTQTIGSVSDFGKFGLLRRLAGFGLHVGVNWYLMPDDDVIRDRTIGYADNAYRSCDPALWDDLEMFASLPGANLRDLRQMELLPAEYYGPSMDFSSIPDVAGRNNERLRWHREAMDFLFGADVFFLDADKGLATDPAMEMGDAVGYIMPEELREYYQSGATVMYCEKDAAKLEALQNMLLDGEIPGARCLIVRCTAGDPSYCCFVMQPQHDMMIRGELEALLAGEWSQCLSFYKA